MKIDLPTSSRSLKPSQHCGITFNIDNLASSIIESKVSDVGTLVRGVTNALSTFFSQYPDFCIFADFKPEGCEWCVVLAKKGVENKKLSEFNDNNFYVLIGLVEKRVRSSLDHRFARRRLETSVSCSHSIHMVLKVPNDLNMSVTEGSKDYAKRQFTLLSCEVRKMICRLEFPNFPDGNSGKPFKKIYQVNRELNRGAFGYVYLGRNRETDKIVAIKVVDRSKLYPEDDAAIFTEVALMSCLDHRNIVKVIDFFEENNRYLIIMEYLSGGDLFDRIGRKTLYTEEDARDACRSLVEAVKHCHDNCIAHRDLKSKNLLLSSESNDTDLKLTDFGFATRFSGPNSLARQCGTPFFVAPEIIRREAYDQRADMWSVGVIIYLLLSGDLPFWGRNINELYRKILSGSFNFPDKAWSAVSSEAKELIRHLLVLDTERRWCANRALRSQWMRKEGLVLKMNDLSHNALSIRNFNAKLKFKASVYAVEFANVTYSMILDNDNSRGNGIMDSIEEEE